MKIAILLGGSSMERDISISSAKQVIQALRSLDHDVSLIDLSTGILSLKSENEIFSSNIKPTPPDFINEDRSIIKKIISEAIFLDFDLVFIALHGGVGENGVVQSILEEKGIPYTGSNSKSSALAMDKDQSKKIFVSNGVLTPDWTIVTEDNDFNFNLEFPLIVKPNSQGSTVGLSYVDNAILLKNSISKARLYDSKVIVENYISGNELTVGVLNNEPLSVGHIIPSDGEIFDYESKYQPGLAEEIFPADISPKLENEIKDIAIRVHNILGLNNYSRIDFIVDSEERIWCLEANTLPGLSAGSLLPKSALAVGISFEELCAKIVSKTVKQ